MKLNKQKGFTIIEVLIVLAIAGLILLIVFLAVPALQRNSRNTQIRNDVATVLGMISEYQTNNNGNLPGVVCSDGNGNVNMIASGTCTASATSRIGQVRPGTVVNGGPATTVPPTALGTISIAINNGCNGVLKAAKSRAVAAQFRVETADDATGTPQCQET